MRAPMKNASRERRKAERAALAIQAERLERELEKRLSTRAQAKAWRSQAHDEIRKRRLAESTNDQLQDALRRQETTLIALLESLRDRLSKPTPVKAPVPSRRLHDAHGRRFAMLLDDVDRAYHTDLRHVVQNVEDATDQLTTRLVQHHGERVLEASRVSAMACALPRCCEALWTASEQVTTATHTTAWVSRPSPDVVLRRLQASSARHGIKDSKVTWVATSSLVEKRFYCDGDRMAIVWRAVTSVDNRAELADVYVDETGWTLVLEDETHDKECVRVADCVQTVPRSTKVVGEEETTAKDLGLAIRQFTCHVMEATTARVDAIRDRMENLLIDDCMREVEP